jgi:hypothetical protein
MALLDILCAPPCLRGFAIKKSELMGNSCAHWHGFCELAHGSIRVNKDTMFSIDSQRESSGSRA